MFYKQQIVFFADCVQRDCVPRRRAHALRVAVRALAGLLLRQRNPQAVGTGARHRGRKHQHHIPALLQPIHFRGE